MELYEAVIIYNSKTSAGVNVWQESFNQIHEIISDYFNLSMVSASVRDDSDCP